MSIEKLQSATLVAACRAYFKVMKKNYIDDVFNDIKMLVKEERERWISEDITSNHTLQDRAVEPIEVRE